MSVVIALGSNLGNKIEHLKSALDELSTYLSIISASQIYRSDAVDYTDQPEFFNQLIEFKTPTNLTPGQLIKVCLEIEQKLGRTRHILRGPRTVDIDIIFWDNLNIQTPDLIIPHPRWMDRSFIVRPLQELPCFEQISSWHKMPTSFTIEAVPV